MPPDLSEGELATQLGAEPALERARAHAPKRRRPLARGDVVGRYVVLEKLGAGGMGEVYAAYDPELDRKIAVKLLLAGDDGSKASSGPGRLMREAQAMAKLKHPNVVAVHDVGAHDDRVFIAMEFVDGETLADWIADGPRPWAEVISRYLAAGTGLAAAHAAGLIHRDFKPANVLVDRDGSIRVADFGLARRAVRESEVRPSSSDAEAVALPEVPADDATLLAATPPAVAGAPPPTPSPASLDSRSRGSTSRSGDSLSLRMTMTGATLGTPAYMAPEQYRGGDVDARADQFSFCVAVWEALYGQRPFGGDNLHSLMFAVTEGRLREPPANLDVPAPIRRALVRGLAGAPDQRWPSMGALLEELRFDPGKRRRQGIVAVIGVALAGTVAWGFFARSPPAPVEPPCAGADTAFGEALSSARRQAVDERFRGFEHAWAHDVGERLLPRLDRWALTWKESWVDACEDTKVRGEQSEELLDRRMLCLDRQRRGFERAVDALSEADEVLARKADGYLDEVGSPAACNDAEALLRITPMPDDPVKVEAIVHAEEVMGEALGHYLGARYDEAKKALEGEQAAIQQLDYDPLSAAYEQMRGRLEMHLGDAKEGERALERAFVLALQSGDDARTIKIARSLALELKDVDRNDEAMRWLNIGGALIARNGGDEATLGSYAIARSQALANLGDVTGAEREAKLAFEYLSRAKPDSAVLGDALYLMAVSAHRAGRYQETLELLEQARKAWSSDIGPRHPRNGAALTLMGITARVQGDYATAQKYLEESLAIDVATYGADHVQTTDRLMNLAVVLGDQGKLDEAIAYNQRALAIRRAQPDASPLSISRTLANLAQMERLAGRTREAHEVVLEAETSVRQALGPDHPDVATTLHIRAMIELDLGELAAADRLIREALGIVERSLGAESPGMDELRTDAAEIALARGEVGEAKRQLEAEGLRSSDSRDKGKREYMWARVHDALGHRAEAAAAAERARVEFTSMGDSGARELAKLEAWLAAR